MVTGETLSTGGRAAQGDFEGGAAVLLEEFVPALSVVPFNDRLPPFACCPSRLPPSFKTVAFGPIEVEGLITIGLVSSDSCWLSEGIDAGAGSCAATGKFSV